MTKKTMTKNGDGDEGSRPAEFPDEEFRRRGPKATGVRFEETTPPPPTDPSNECPKLDRSVCDLVFESIVRQMRQSAVRPSVAVSGCRSIIMSHLLHQLVFAAALFASFIRASSAAASSQQQQQQPPLVFGQCDRRHTNLTAQECVGKAILDTLTRVTEHPENYFGTAANEQDSEGGTTMRLIKLKFDNDTMLVDQRFEMDESRSSSGASIWEQLVYVIKKLANYGTDHGIMVSLPQWTKAFPPVTVIEEDQITQVINESRSKHGPYKKYALLFPLLATFKFLVIKSLLVPILFAVMFIKKLVVLAVMSLPYVLTMLRFCRNPNNFGFGGFGPGNLVATGAMAPVGQAAAFAPLTADMSGDYSSYVQQAAAASSQNNPYKEYSKNMMETMKATYRRRR